MTRSLSLGAHTTWMTRSPGSTGLINRQLWPLASFGQSSINSPRKMTRLPLSVYDVSWSVAEANVGEAPKRSGA